MKKIILFQLLVLPFFLLSQTCKEKNIVIGINVNSIGELASNGLGNYTYGKSLNGGIAKFNSYSLGVNATYFITDDLGFRCKVATTKWAASEYRDSRNHQPTDTQNVRIDDVTYKSSDLSFSLGLLYNYSEKKINIYGGIDLKYTNHSKGIYTNIILEAGVNTGNTKIKATTTLPKGNSYGLGAFTGLNFFLTNYLSIGLEVSSALQKTKITTIEVPFASFANASVKNFSPRLVDP